MCWLKGRETRKKRHSSADLRLVQRPCEAGFLGLEIGASQSTLPVGAKRFRRTPHIALSGAFLALRASVCNRWPRRWVSGRRREWISSTAWGMDTKGILYIMVAQASACEASPPLGTQAARPFSGADPVSHHGIWGMDLGV